MIGSVNIVLNGVSCQVASLTLVARMTSNCFLTGAGFSYCFSSPSPPNPPKLV